MLYFYSRGGSGETDRWRWWGESTARAVQGEEAEEEGGVSGEGGRDEADAMPQLQGDGDSCRDGGAHRRMLQELHEVPDMRGDHPEGQEEGAHNQVPRLQAAVGADKLRQ